MVIPSSEGGIRVPTGTVSFLRLDLLLALPAFSIQFSLTLGKGQSSLIHLWGVLPKPCLGNLVQIAALGTLLS